MLKNLAWIVPISIATTLALPALANFILPGRCHQGACSEYTYLSKTAIGDGRTGRLYEVQLSSRTYFDNGNPDYFERMTSYVYCSTRNPHYIFIPEYQNSPVATMLNPGGDDYPYAFVDFYPVYWATCHNFVGPNFFSQDMKARAIRLGYPLNFPSSQFDLNNVRDILGI